MVRIKTAEEIEGIRAASKVVAQVFEVVKPMLLPGTTTYQIDNMVRHTLRDLGAKSAFHKYKQGGKKSFPAYACISVNEEVVHGIGKFDKALNDGDIITVDVGSVLNGFYGDAAFTQVIGNAKPNVVLLNERTREALYKAIEITRAGIGLYDISRVIEETAKKYGYGSVIDYFGHGVGLQLHEPPQVPNAVPSFGYNLPLRAGMTITYEPMFTLGTGVTKELNDGWTVVTTDGSWAAHWEHTLLVTETGVEILTELK